ncbi:hypothetical protein [Gordonia phthalatica]|uniref:Phospholipase A2 n=1 Tax=Gordonia phthalatica TaxID=1136941 RepID=A0A0N9NHH7_9ACTN|nr:hypothetical protein [Gordonia phthalatica]ALG86637.1 hypothetical protein ACH46_05750 [Gordonia phthalatica]
MIRKASLTSWFIRIGVGLAIAVGILGLLPITAALASASRPTTPPVGATAAERTIAALVGEHPRDALTALPADFEARFGYRPVVVDGRPLNPRGDCSSPVPLPDRFTDACRAHDLGYDLLRYAAAVGRPAGSWARTALDARLIDDMHAVCDDLVCDAAAEAARVGLAMNTWRQRSGPPVRESGAEIAATYLTRTLESAGRK